MDKEFYTKEKTKVESAIEQHNDNVSIFDLHSPDECPLDKYISEEVFIKVNLTQLGENVLRTMQQVISTKFPLKVKFKSEETNTTTALLVGLMPIDQMGIIALDAPSEVLGKMFQELKIVPFESLTIEVAIDAFRF